MVINMVNNNANTLNNMVLFVKLTHSDAEWAKKLPCSFCYMEGFTYNQMSKGKDERKDGFVLHLN